MPQSSLNTHGRRLQRHINIPDTMITDPDDDIQITAVVSPTNDQSNLPSTPGLVQRLQDQHIQQQRRIRRENERQRLRQQRNSHRIRRLSQHNDNNLSNQTTQHIDTTTNDPASRFYSNPNSHIHEDGPILITSDVEDLESVEQNSVGDSGFYSDTATVGSTDTSSSRVRMALSADERFVRNSRSTQHEPLRNFLAESNNQSSTQTNRRIPLETTIDENDDDIQFVGERELPEVQILQSVPGYELYTPSGPLFVPTTSPNETRRGGGRINMVLGSRNENRQRVQVPNPNSSALPNFMRVDNDRASRQEVLRQRQFEANRRARDAANNTVADRVHRRTQRRFPDRRVVRPINHPNLNFDGQHHSHSNILRFLQSLGFRDGDSFPFHSGFVPSSELFMNAGLTVADDLPDEVMHVLQRRDDERENQRVRARSAVANTEKKKKASEGRVGLHLKEKFSNNLGEEGHSDVCVLCGIVLLEGIPVNHNEENANKEDDMKKLIKEGFQSPWKAWNKFNGIDIDLSKKVFFGSCGHIYCGRCVNNIMRFRGMTVGERKKELAKSTQKSKKQDVVSATNTDFEHAEFSAPLKCIAEGCNKKFMGKTPFTELYV